MAQHRKHRNRLMSGGGTANLIFTVIVVVTVAILGALLYSDHVQEDENAAKLNALVEQERERRIAEEQEQRLEAQRREQLRKEDSFYQKLADGFDVNLLIVGDSIAEGGGASDGSHAWASMLAESIHRTYNVKANMTNVSMGGNTSYAGYVRTMALDNNVDYDLVVLCYGQNDGLQNFDLYYESIIQAVKNKYPNASIICILESSQRDYTAKMQTIQAIAAHYALPVADTIETFRENYDSLVSDSVHPNDAGNEVYCETVMAVIEPLVTARQGRDPEADTINDAVTIFDTFQWIPADKFVREGNTFVCNTNVQGTIMGIDYNFTSGENSCKIYVDDVEYAAPEVSFNYDFSQRHIMILNNWTAGDAVNIQNELRIVFDDSEAGTKQADGFKGIAISGLIAE